MNKFNALPVVGPPVRTEVNTYLIGLVRSLEEIKIITLKKGKFPHTSPIVLIGRFQDYTCTAYRMSIS